MKQRLTRWLIVLPTSLTIACGGRSCSSTQSGTTAPASTITASSRADRLAEPLRSSLNAAIQVMMGGPKANGEEIRRQFTALATSLRAVNELLFKDPISPSALLAQAGQDPLALHQWVRTNVALVPYRGVLRGPIGTLADRAGNSVDRALLLARLLKDAGLPVRLARARIPENRAEDFRREAMARTSNAQATQPDPEEQAYDVMDAYAQKVGASAKDLRDRIAQTATASAQLIQDARRHVALQSAMVANQLGHLEKSATDVEHDADVDALRDHWWVQWQQGSSWKDLDPSLSAAGEAISPADETLQPSQLAADFFHDISISVVIEQWDGSSFKEARAVEHRYRPSEAPGASIVLGHQPMHWSNPGSSKERNSSATFTATAQQQHEWLPYLIVDGKRISRSSFTDTGNLNERPGRALGGVTTAAGGLADAFGGGDEAKPGVLTGEWIEYEIRAPGQQPQLIRREIFDLVGPSNRTAGHAPDLTDPLRLRRSLALLGETEVLALGFQPSSAFVADRFMSVLNTNAPVLDSIFAGTTRQPSPDQLAKLRPLPGPLYDFAVARAQLRAPERRVHLDRINILSRHSFPTVKSNGTIVMATAFDVVANHVGAAGATPNDRFMARLEQGVLDSTLEAVLAGSGDVATTVDLFGVDDRAQPWATIRTSADAETTGLPDDIRARIGNDLRDGFVVLAPTQKQLGAAPAAWWRIDPRTGDLLAIGDRGWGQGMTENQITVFQVGMTTLCFLLAGMDPDGLTLKDALVCIMAAGSAATGLQAAFTPGMKVAGAVMSAIYGMLGTGIWLNNSPGLNQSVAGSKP